MQMRIVTRNLRRVKRFVERVGALLRGGSKVPIISRGLAIAVIAFTFVLDVPLWSMRFARAGCGLPSFLF